MSPIVLLIESLEHSARVEVAWRESRFIDLPGRTVFAGRIIVGAWTVGRPSVPVTHHAEAAALIAAQPEVRSSLESFRLALTTWDGDLKAGVTYLWDAVEVLVAAVGAETKREDWARFGELIGLGRERTEQLYLSLQHFRHVNVTHAERRLSSIKLPRLGASDCLSTVRDVIRVYVAWAKEKRPDAAA